MDVHKSTYGFQEYVREDSRLANARVSETTPPTAQGYTQKPPP